MTRAEETACLAQIAAVFGDDCVLIVAGWIKVLEDSTALDAAHRFLPQVFEQRLAVDQTQGGMSECGSLCPQSAEGGDLVHEARVLALPQLPTDRALEYAVRNQVLHGIAAMQRGLDAISRLAHQTRMRDGTAVHPFILLRHRSTTIGSC